MKSSAKKGIKQSRASTKKAYSRFSQAERDLAQAWLKQDKKEIDIAKLLGRDPGTVCRQLQKPTGFVPELGRKKVITTAVYKKLAKALLRSHTELAMYKTLRFYW